MKAIFGLIVLTAAAGAAGAWYWIGQPRVGPEFRTLTVSRGDLTIGLTATGTVEPEEVIDVGAQIMGRIRSFGPDAQSKSGIVDFGSQVKKGDILARIDDSPYLVELEKAQANVVLAEAELERFRAMRKRAEQDFERAKALRNTISEAEFDTAQSDYIIAQQDVEIGTARLEQAKIVRSEAQLNLGYTKIESPIDGVVIDRRVNVGQTVVASLNAPSLFLMAKDLSRMQVLAAVNEADIGEIQVGQQVTFEVDAYRDATFSGRVSQIRLNASLLHNVVMFGVVVDIDNTLGKLLPYMTANLHFVVASRSDVILVPNQALRWRPTWEQVTPESRRHWTQPGDAGQKLDVREPMVWMLADDGLARHVPVETGLSDGIVTEIVDGSLEPGAKVIINAVQEAQPDFVSGFIERVTKKDEDEDAE